MTKLLIEKDADVNAQSALDATALLLAVVGGARITIELN